MASPLPPQFAAYPRSNTVETYGSVEQLEALGKGYFSLNRVFLLQTGLVIIGLFVAGFAVQTEGNVGLVGAMLTVIGICVAVFFITLPKNRMIAFGMNWKDQSGIFPSILMAITWFFCLGALGYVVMQSIALKEMKKYGLTGGSFGLRKKQFLAFVESRRSAPVNLFHTVESTPPSK